MKIKIFVAVLALSFSSTGFATLPGGTTTISQILMYEGGGLIYIFLDGGVQNTPSCHGSNGDYISYSMSRPMAKEYLSALLAAFMAQKPVEFRIEETCIDQSVSATLSYFSIIN